MQRVGRAGPSDTRSGICNQAGSHIGYPVTGGGPIRPTQSAQLDSKIDSKIYLTRQLRHTYALPSPSKETHDSSRRTDPTVPGSQNLGSARTYLTQSRLSPG